MLYLVFGLSVDVPDGGVGVEGGVGMVPADDLEAPGRQRFRGLSLGHRVHLALQARAQAVARLCCTHLWKEPPAVSMQGTSSSYIKLTEF